MPSTSHTLVTMRLWLVVEVPSNKDGLDCSEQINWAATQVMTAVAPVVAGCEVEDAEVVLGYDPPVQTG
jgi:hypothetical protein